MIPSLLQWDDIRYFLAVAQAGSLNAAAKRLGVNQTTVGRRVKVLEARLGADLFDRRDNRLVLTGDGSIAYQEALKMEEVIGSFVRKLRGSNTRLAGEVRLNMTEGLATYWLLPRLHPFQEDHPDLSINWFITDNILDLGREVDIAIRWQQPKEPSAVVRKLGACRYSLYANKNYVDKKGLPASMEDLKKHDFLQFNGYEKNPGLHRWNTLVKELSPVMRLDNTAFTEAVFKSSMVLTLLPDYAVRVDPTIVRVPLDLGISLDVWLAYHEDRRKSARVRALASEVVRLFELDKGTWFT